jgi:hypothetical protein
METQAKYEVAERQNGELVNPQTGEIAVTRVFENEFDMKDLLPTAAKIDLTEEQKKILFAQVDPVNVEIRYDGIVYLPWMEYASRLSEAFGLKWALIPQGMPKFKSNFVYWGFWLIIDGHLSGYAIGEQRYFPESKGGKDFMTYGDACEGAKSNALMRLCKGLGISLELWRPSFVRDWKAKYAFSFKDAKGNTAWKRKDKTEDTENGNIPDSKPPKEPTKKAPSKFEFLKIMGNMKKELGEYVYYEILGGQGYEHANQITERDNQVAVYKVMMASLTAPQGDPA